MRFDRAHELLELLLLRVWFRRLERTVFKKLKHVAMLLLQEIKRIHGPSPTSSARVDLWNQ